MRLKIKSLALASLLLIACNSTPTATQNSFTWAEDFNGRGAWDWGAYSTLYSENPVWRQIDWPFSFSYPGVAPLSGSNPWEIEENMDSVSLVFEEILVSFMVAAPKEAEDDRVLEEYCQQHVNGSNQTITFEESITVGNRAAHWIEYDDSSDSSLKESMGTNSQQEGTVVCIDLEDSWMDIYASPLIDEAEFQNILGSLLIGDPLTEDGE